jgi:hypothetical protein
LRRSGIATTRDAADCNPADARGQRVVVKPDDGAGACETRVHATLAEARGSRSPKAAGTRVRRRVLEEGAPLSLSLLCGARGDVDLLSVNRQIIHVAADGAVRYGGVAVGVHDYDASADAFAALRAGRRGRDAGLARLRGHRPRSGRRRASGGRRDQSARHVRLRGPFGRARPQRRSEVLRQHERVFAHA